MFLITLDLVLPVSNLLLLKYALQDFKMPQFVFSLLVSRAAHINVTCWQLGTLSVKTSVAYPGVFP